MRRAICILATIAVLFSQLALAAYACPMPGGVPVAATMPAGGDCCGGRGSLLCGAHCAQASQVPERPLASNALPTASMVLAIQAPLHVVLREAGAPQSASRPIPPPGPQPALRSRLRI